MGKLYYYYGTMSSAKSLNLLAKAHQFKTAGSKVTLMKPSIDTRTNGTISSRVGLEEKCTLIHKDEMIYIPNDVDVVMIDECQFLTPKQVEQLWFLSRENNVRIFCYGLKVTYSNELFESIKTMFVYADSINEIKSQCAKCDAKATTHLFYKGDKVIKNGAEVNVGDIEGEEKYLSVCQRCWQLAD